ncbi:hypothetical protein ACFLXC_03510 [Chloroflexota bacterium]
MIEVLTSKGELKITDRAKEQLGQMSASTIDRILRRYPHSGGRRNFSTTRPGTLLKNCIPISTFSDWDEKKPGFFLTTLSAVDVATGRVEPVAVWRKGSIACTRRCP